MFQEGGCRFPLAGTDLCGRY